MNNYTPTTEAVRAYYNIGRYEADAIGDLRAFAEFDLWLAGRDRRVKASALRGFAEQLDNLPTEQIQINNHGAATMARAEAARLEAQR